MTHTSIVLSMTRKIRLTGTATCFDSGIKIPYKTKRPVVGYQSATGYLVSFESELS